jgi:hypothetical protein
LRKLRDVRDPGTYFLAFPAPMVSGSRKLRRPLEAPVKPDTIPMLHSSRLARELQALGFDCPPPTRYAGGLSWVMRWTSPAATYRVEVIGPHERAIRRVEASLLGVPPFASREHAADFLGFIASVPYQGCDPDLARAWVGEHTGADAEAIIGGACMRLSHRDRLTELQVRALCSARS